MDQQQDLNTRRPSATYLPLWMFIFAAVALVAGGVGVADFIQARDMRRLLASSRQDVATLSSRIEDSNEAIRRDLIDLHNRIASDEQQAQARVDENNVAAPQAAQHSAKRRGDGTGRHTQNDQQAKIKALQAQLAQVEKSSQETSAKLDSMSNDVSTVKGEVASTRTDLDNATTEMQRVRGDMGVMSGLIATNGKEIEELRRLGDRNIFEFSLNTDDGERKVGDILVKLEKVNVKHNRYSVVINADDKRIEKKDKTTNEPVQFYVASKARQPYEIVVNEVSKHTIKGYLATPKVTLTRQAAVQPQ